MQWARFNGPPTGFLTHEDTPRTGDSFEHDEPPGSLMISESVIVPGLCFEAFSQWLPGITPEKPGVSEGSVARLVI
jgi:hypothetical protein